MLSGSREFEIVESAHILNAEEPEYIIYAHRELRIWTVGVHHRTSFRKFHQYRGILILRKERIVLVREPSPESFETNDLTPFQFL